MTDLPTAANGAPADHAADERISWLRVPDETELPAEVTALFATLREKRGFVQNFFRAFALNPVHLLRATGYLFELMDPKGTRLSLRERELIAVVVSAENRCDYCLVSHGAALRRQTGDPELADRVALNYRRAGLQPRERALADLAVRITRASHELQAADLEPLRALGLTDEELLEAIEVAAFFNYTNRLTSAVGVRPDARLFTAHR